MTAAPIPDGEYARLLALARYSILDSAPEERFDRLTQLVAQALNVPIALINFVDQFRQWGKSCVGLDSSEAPREHSFCAWTILQDAVMVVPDAAQDARFNDNPMVLGAPYIHLYAGAPLLTSDGHRIGTLCVTDDRPHPFGEREQGLLRRFAALVVELLELRVHELELEREVEAQKNRVEDLRRAAAHAQTLSSINALFDTDLSPEDATRASAELLCEAAEIDSAGLVRSQDGQLDVVAFYDRRGPDQPPMAQKVRQGGITGFAVEAQANLFIDDYPSHPQAQPLFVKQGVTSVAVLALGETGEARYVLLASRIGRARPWRASDRALLEAAARSVRGALRQRTHLQRAETAALVDSLTGLFNRRAFDEALRDLAPDTPCSVLMVDLDGMKTVNDQEGHERGDALLRLFAGALRGQLRTSDRVFRLGGDEFAALIDSVEPQEEDLLERLDLAVLAVRAGGFPEVGASAGLAVRTAGETPLALVPLPDERMYQQKRRKAELRGRSPTP